MYALVGMLSLVIALAWSVSKEDASAGFTIGAYKAAVLSGQIFAMQMRHNKKCRCDG